MSLRPPNPASPSLVILCLCGLIAWSTATAQQTIGSVPLQDATVTGALQVTSGKVELVGSTTVTAHDHTAQVALARGGSVHVCATSGLHLTAGRSAAGSADQPLLLALDRGAIEIETHVSATDAVMTPDLRLTPRTGGQLDLRLRVTRNGDTCVENAGSSSPAVGITETFGDATYELRPGQHVLFEHGSLKEVVDHETSPCGCPPPTPVSVADSGVASATPAAPGTPAAATQAEAQHPFPAAVSEGLAPGSDVPQAPAGVAHAQVAATLAFNADGSHTGDSLSAAPSASSAPATAPAAAEAVSRQASNQSPGASPERAQAPDASGPPPVKDLAHTIGRFFKRLFRRN